MGLLVPKAGELRRLAFDVANILAADLTQILDFGLTFVTLTRAHRALDVAPCQSGCHLAHVLVSDMLGHDQAKGLV